MGEVSGPYDQQWIAKMLPHRYPLLLVDRVLEIEHGERIVALKNVTRNEPFFDGHFPGYPIMPGVLIIEALAQTAALLLTHSRSELEGQVIFFAGIERARFRRPVFPGDQLRLQVDVIRVRSMHSRFRGQARVEGELCVDAICSSMIKEGNQNAS